VIEWLAVAFLYAVGSIGLLGQIAGALGIPLTLPTYGVLLLAALVVVSFEKVPKREPQTPIAWAATMLTLLPIAVLILNTVTTPLSDYDGRVTWMLKAKAIAREHSITGPFFKGQTSRNAHSQYPLLMPVAAAGIFEVTGSDDDRVVRPLYSLIAIAFLIVLRAAMQRVAGVSAAAVITAAVAWLPQFAADNDGGMTSGYSDLPMIAFVSLALLTVSRESEVGSRAGDSRLTAHDLRLSWRFGLQLAFVACVKNEGVVLAIALFFLARFLWKSLLPVAITLAALAFWRAHIPLEYDENYPQLLRHLGAKVSNYPEAASALLSRMLVFRVWGAFWILAAIGALIERKRLAVASVFVLFVYITTYAVTNWTIAELAVSSAHRLLLHLVPFAAMLMAVSVRYARSR
jgi:hypothetical protein